MEPGWPLSLPQRIWVIDIRTHVGAPLAVCDRCGPLQRSPDQALRTSVLHHLSLDAQSDVTPQHLRTCQCGRHGCPWHGRTRGCSGPILLALFWSPGPGTWRLADLCHQCCAATPHTAPVPHAPPAATHRPPDASPPEDPDEEQPLVWETACLSCCVTHDGTCEEAPPQ
jgi:hypothetical protein